MRGRAPTVECCYCGRRTPRDKATRFRKRNFGFFDDRYGIEYRGIEETEFACISCARHRGIKNDRPMRGRPKFR